MPTHRGHALSIAAVLLGSSCVFVACGNKTDAVTPERLQQQYGLVGAYTDEVPTSDGALRGTLVPVTLADGRQAQLFVPEHPRRQPHAVYFRDDQGLHPVHVQENATRAELTTAPALVATQPEPVVTKKRSWEKEALIIGGSAGAGTALGAVAGGKKGAAVGATAGGIGGLIYDLATRHHE